MDGWINECINGNADDVCDDDDDGDDDNQSHQIKMF